MKDKLEAGMYVRHKTLLSSKYVKINKIKEIEEKENCLHIWLEDKDLITEKYLINASYNIIDILEVGDYVNGSKVANIVEEDGMQYLVLDRDEVFYDNCLEPSSNKDIKSIVTHEQMEQMAYKVGD